MNRHLLNRRWLLVVLPVFLALTLVLSACNQDSGSGSSTGATKPPVAVATAERIQLGPQPVPLLYNPQRTGRQSRARGPHRRWREYCAAT